MNGRRGSASGTHVPSWQWDSAGRIYFLQPSEQISTAAMTAVPH